MLPTWKNLIRAQEPNLYLDGTKNRNFFVDNNTLGNFALIT